LVGVSNEQSPTRIWYRGRRFQNRNLTGALEKKCRNEKPDFPSIQISGAR